MAVLPNGRGSPYQEAPIAIRGFVRMLAVKKERMTDDDRPTDRPDGTKDSYSGLAVTSTLEQWYAQLIIGRTDHTELEW